MDDFRNKKDWLSEYLPLKCEYENQLERLERMRSNEECPSMTFGNESQHMQNSNQRMAKAIENRLMFEMENEIGIVEIEKKLKAVEKAIDALQDPLEREVLRLRYMDGTGSRKMKWSEVAFKLYKSDDTRSEKAIIRLHNSAIDHLQCQKSNQRKER